MHTSHLMDHVERIQFNSGKEPLVGSHFAAPNCTLICFPCISTVPENITTGIECYTCASNTLVRRRNDDTHSLDPSAARSGTRDHRLPSATTGSPWCNT